MPSIAAHMVCCKNVAKILNINNDMYILGNILPDISNNIDSHYKIKGNYFLVPDINRCIKELRYDKYLYLGYICHLLLDKYYLEEFIPNNVDNFKYIFINGTIYTDYSHINYKLVQDYNIDVDKIICILNNEYYFVDNYKRDKNINFLINKECSKEKIINYDMFKNFLKDTSYKIAKKIKKIEGLKW